MKRLFLLLLLVPLCFSTVVVNSMDGRDVVSGIYYAAVADDDVVFVTPAYNEVVVYNKIGGGNDILLIQSEDYPIITSMRNELEARGNTVETLLSEDPYETNLELAERSGADGFILVDPVYGYNTVSVLAYAKLNSMHLVFVDKDNMESVVDFLDRADAEDILLYGYIESDVKNLLGDAGFEYSEINNGDKFDDNLEIIELYFEQNPSKKQVILSDGNGIEDTIAAGDDPVILISQVIPLSVQKYMEENAVAGQIQVAMVVDQEYAQTAYDLKTTINNDAGSKVLSVLVKLGESATTAGTGLTDVRLFPLPGPILGLEIAKVEYNTVSNELEITFENTGNALEYVTSQTLVFADGVYVGTVGDDEPFAVGRDGKYGIGYPVEIEEGHITANITAFFGSSKKSTEKGIQVVMDAGRVEFIDESKLNITDFVYDSATGDLLVTYSNRGDTVVYLKPDATINLEGTSTKIEDENTYELDIGEGRVIKFPGIVKTNSIIVAGADYGAREAFLENRIEQEYEPSVFEFDMNILYIAVIIILVLVIGYFVWDKLKKK